MGTRIHSRAFLVGRWLVRLVARLSIFAIGEREASEIWDWEASTGSHINAERHLARGVGLDPSKVTAPWWWKP